MPTNSIEVRPARASELQELSQAFESVVLPLEVYSIEARQEEIRKYSVSHLAELSSSNPEDVLVAVVDGAISGFCLTRDDDHLLWLSWYGVVPAMRGKGVARRLLMEMKNLAKARGYWKVWCDSRTDNGPSIRCMKDVGFELICEIKRHWYGQDFVLLQCYLDDTPQPR